MGDNVYYTFGCPAKMSDSRLFTDWYPKDMLDSFYMNRLQASTEHDYRKKLQAQGIDLMKEQITYYLKNATCHCNQLSCRKQT